MKRILIILILSTSLFAQSFDGVSLGLAGNYAALSRGIHSLGFNPANVAVPRNDVVEFNLLSLNLGLFNNAFSYHSYNKFFVTNGKENYWDQNKKDAFLNLIPNNGLIVNSDLNANVLGLAFNNFAMAVHPVVFGKIRNSKIKTVLDIALNGDDVTRDYSLNLPDFAEGSAFAAMGVSLNYAYPIPIKRYLPDFSFMSVGLGINYYLGLAVLQTQEANASVKRTSYDDHEIIETNLVTTAKVATPEGATPAGKGRSYDFGLSALYKDKWFVSLSFLNIGGKIKYSTNTKRLISSSYSVTTIYASMDKSSQNFHESTDTTVTIAPFNVDVPAYMRLGLAYYFKKNLIFTSEWKQGLNNAFGNSTKPRFGVGVEYKPLWWLPLRSGISVGGNTNFLMGVGMGLDFKYLSLDFSYAMKNALWPTHSEGLFLGMNLMIRI